MGAGIQKLREVEGGVERVGPVGRQVVGGEKGDRAKIGWGWRAGPKVKAEMSPPLAFDSKSTWTLRSDLLSNVAWGVKFLELAQRVEKEEVATWRARLWW